MKPRLDGFSPFLQSVSVVDRRGAGVGGVGVLGDSTDSDSSGGGVLLLVLGEVTPSVN